jgi:hypothetical protein
MQINLNVLGPLVLNGVGGQVNGTNIIAVHNSGLLKRAMELVQQLTQPTRLGDSIGATAQYSTSALDLETVA